MPRTCRKCGKTFKYTHKRNDGKVVNLGSRLHCLECVPFGEREKVGRQKVSAGVRGCKKCGRIFDQSGRNMACSSCRGGIRRDRNRQKAIEYKGGKCQCCGYSKYYGSLDFHHIDPQKKEFEISRHWQCSWEKLKTELDKCLLVCSNCHGEIHGGLIDLAQIPQLAEGFA